MAPPQAPPPSTGNNATSTAEGTAAAAAADVDAAVAQMEADLIRDGKSFLLLLVPSH